jgi:ATP-binding cassette subfamily B protein
MSKDNKNKRTISIWYLLRYFKPYLFLILSTAFFLILGQIAASLGPIWLKKIIDNIQNNLDFNSIIKLMIIYFGLRFLSFICDYLRDLIFAPAEMGISRDLSKELFGHLISLPINYHFDQKIGGISRKITRGGRAATFILDFIVINILPTIIQLGIVTYLLFKLYEPIYAVATFATIISYALFTLWSTEKRQKFRIAANVADDEVASLEVDALSNIETIKYFNNEQEQKINYKPAVDNRYKFAVKSNQLFALISAGQGLILLIGLAVILYFAITQTINHILTIGDLVLLITYIVNLSAPIGTLGFVYRQIKDGIVDLDGMAKILQEENTVVEPKNPVKITKPKGEVTFDRVGFTYDNKRNILHDIELKILPGQNVAFVGPSGVGKSTIVKLLFRFFDPTMGKILIDGVDLKLLSKSDRRRLFGIVPQEPALFNTTIGENIRFGKPDASQSEIVKAAKLANIDTFIQSLPDKYETLVGERGVKLSGGEKQRVAIARAIIRDPKIIVFDEATSSLDSNSEKVIQESLESVSKGRTTIAIAHRLSTIANCDVINVLDKGKVVESGRHDDLIKLNGLYSRLWKIQGNKENEQH